MTGRRQIGAKGEAVAANALVEAGFEIVERNWRTRFGEVDLIARNGDLLLFVEVKTRRSASFGTGAAAVDARKQKKMIRAAKGYLARHATGRERSRFDVIVVRPEREDAWRVDAWIEGAFWVESNPEP